MSDKNQAVIDFLLNCPKIQENKLFFNFINAKDNNTQFIAQANDKSINRPYIDGSELKRFTFTIIGFKSISYEALVKMPGYSNENLDELLDVQGIIDWVDEQADLRNFPDFGEKCDIDSMSTTSENPNLNGVDTSTSPPLAKYSFTIQIDYLDRTKQIWN